MAAPVLTPAPAQVSLPAPRAARHPMLWAAFAFACGILWARAAAAHYWTPPNWQISAAVLLLLISFLISRHTRLASAAALLAICLLGMAQENLGENHTTALLPPQLENQEVEVTGVVTRASLPVFEENLRSLNSRAGSESYQQLDLLASQVSCVSGSVDNCPAITPLGVRIGIYEAIDDDETSPSSSGASAHVYRYGQLLHVRGRIRTPPTYENPGSFDYRKYLLDHGIAAVSSARPGSVQVLPEHGGTFLGTMRDRARRSLLDHVLSLASSHGWAPLRLNRTDTALLAAMLLGERSFLDETVKTDFQRTGSYHLLVVSGMAVAILTFSVFWFARLIRIPDMGATILSISFVGLYVSVTDLGTPVQRAALMCAVYFLARLLYRERNPLNAIGTAALVVLIVDARALFDSGFQMTFLAVLAITGIAVPILERSTGFYLAALYQFDSTGFDLHLLPRQAQFRLSLRMILSRLELLLPRWLARLALLGGTRVVLRVVEVVFVSALMQAALAAPMAVYFHRATTLALPANVVVVPLMSLLLPTALLTVLASYVGSWFAFVPKCVTALLLHLASKAILTFAHLRMSDLRVPNPSQWALLLWATAFAACMYVAKRNRLLLACAFILLAISDVALIRLRQPDVVAHKLEITAIDVGQGDSLLIVSPEGRTMLVDGGGSIGSRNSGFDIGEDVVSPYLWSRGFSHLDVVVLSHAHDDHIGGLPAIVRNFQPKELWVSPSPRSDALDALIQQAHVARMLIRNRVAGEKFEFGGARIEILAPPADTDVLHTRENDDSMVMRIIYGSTSALLEGDAEKKTEHAITSALEPVTLLKVGHHGSSTSSTPELLNRLQPQFAVISVGRFNRYHHPSPKVVERLGEEGACTFRTDLDGATSFYLDGSRLSSAQWGRERSVMNFGRQWIPLQQAGHCAALQ